MSHKVHPKAYRIKGITDWNSRGYYKNPAVYLEEDFTIRKFLEKKLDKVGVAKIEIERFPGKLNIIIHSARPGLIIGRGGEGIEKLKKELEKVIRKRKVPFYIKKEVKDIFKKDKKGTKKENKKEDSGKEKFLKAALLSEDKKQTRIEIREIRNPWVSAELCSQWIAQQIEKRVPYRKVLKQALGKIEVNKEIKGVKIEVCGRLNGTEIARREWMKRGKLPLQTLRADIDYSKKEAYCTYGVIGIKVWLYKGEKFD